MLLRMCSAVSESLASSCSIKRLSAEPLVILFGMVELVVKSLTQLSELISLKRLASSFSNSEGILPGFKNSGGVDPFL